MSNKDLNLPQHRNRGNSIIDEKRPGVNRGGGKNSDESKNLSNRGGTGKRQDKKTGGR